MDDIASIPGKISDGTPSPPVPPPVLPDFKIKSTVVREMDVLEAPPLAGLPPVEGTITATVHLVEDPKLPDPPPALVPPIDSMVPPRVIDRNLSEWSRSVFVSAMVYDHSRTLLRCHPTGNVKKEIIAWSNLDFNHFSGFSKFEIKAADGTVRQYSLMVSICNVDSQKQAALQARLNRSYEPPVIPALPEGQPAYLVQTNAPEPAGQQLVADLHQLYQNEGPRMAAAYQARIQAQAERRAYYLANPPIPKDVTLNFWEREHPVGMTTDTIKKGGGN